MSKVDVDIHTRLGVLKLYHKGVHLRDAVDQVMGPGETIARRMSVYRSMTGRVISMGLNDPTVLRNYLMIYGVRVQPLRLTPEERKARLPRGKVRLNKSRRKKLCAGG